MFMKLENVDNVLIAFIRRNFMDPFVGFALDAGGMRFHVSGLGVTLGITRNKIHWVFLSAKEDKNTLKRLGFLQLKEFAEKQKSFKNKKITSHDNNFK